MAGSLPAGCRAAVRSKDIPDNLPVQPVDLCGLNQRIDHCADLRAKRHIAEQPVLFRPMANGRTERSARLLDSSSRPSQKNVHQPALLPSGHKLRCAIETLWHRISLVFILRPLKNSPAIGSDFCFPLRISLFRRKRLLRKLCLQCKQSVTEIESGLCRGAAAQLFGKAFQRIRKFSPHMRPAADAAYRFGQTVMICLIPIRMQYPEKPLQETGLRRHRLCSAGNHKAQPPQSIAGCPIKRHT